MYIKAGLCTIPRTMEMLDYCHTYTMIKESYNNGENTDVIYQEPVADRGVTASRTSLSTGDLLCPAAVAVIPKSLASDVQGKLRPLKDAGKSPAKTPMISFESELTFQPKLNAMSLKLAKERAPEKIRTVTERRAAALYAETESNFTFKPKVSSKSVRIVQNLNSTFMDRQHKHVERQKRFIEKMIISYQGNGKLLNPVPTSTSKTPPQLGQLQRCKEKKDVRQSSHQSETGRTSTSDVFLMHNGTSGVDIAQSSSTDIIQSTTKSKGHLPITSSPSQSISSKLSDRSATSCPLKRSEKKLCDSSPTNQSLGALSPYYHPVENLTMKRKRRQHKTHSRYMTHPQLKCKADQSSREEWNDSTKCEDEVTHRVRTHSDATHPRGRLKYDVPRFEKVRHAKQVAESAIKNKKVFLCCGKYPIIRAVLRRRGWVEKHFKGNLPTSSKKDSCDSDNSSDNDSDNECRNSSNCSPRGKENRKKSVPKPKHTRTAVKIKSDKDDSSSSSGDDSDVDGTYDEGDWNAGFETSPDSEFRLMSRVVRNAVSMLIWTTKRDNIDFKFLRKDQMVNHYCKSHSFTTKVGLCSNLRNLLWYEDADPMCFFPRCHVLDNDNEKMNFIDDFHLNSAISILKWVAERYGNERQKDTEGDSVSQDVPSHHSEERTRQCPSELSSLHQSEAPASSGSSNVVPVRALTLALEMCRHFLRSKEHLDIDDSPNKATVITDEMWDLIVEYFYQVVHQGAVIASAHTFLRECQNVLEQLRKYLPQMDIDGMKNVWIVKPGAKSRGRGISCIDNLEDIMKLAGSTVGRKEGKWVVQKYVERPLLVYGVKFDIRQWFLVTDWNPLTLWFYQDCYLRFCTQNFSLDNYDVSIHLANNSIQKHYENGVRDKRLPEENMWSSEDFKDYLKKQDVGHVWNELIYPGMKQAVLYALESCQEIVEYRKNSFELYGADFLIDESFRPWLVEINCSPSMGPSTAVTRKLCAQVLEDTMKVVLDRRDDKNCDTGRFEVAFKQPHLCSPPYIGINLSVDGQTIRRPGLKRQVTSAKMTSLFRPKENKNILSNCDEGHDTTTDTTRPRPRPRHDHGHDTITEESHCVDRETNSKDKEGHDTTTEESHCVKRATNSKDKEETKRRSKRAEGSWALGYVCAAEQAIPIATTFCTSDDNTLRGLATNDYKDSTHVQRRSNRTLAIPKAVLKYSKDAGTHPKTQLPISIGPDNTVKHF